MNPFACLSQLQNIQPSMNNELERISKKAVGAKFGTLLQYLPGRFKENHEKPWSR
jgi:hypothetical protein